MSELNEMVKKADLYSMDKLEDLLPGIEEFLCSVLARESLSPYAEEQRQYFLERLDIIKMPPSVPPRPQSLGVNLFPIDPFLIPSIDPFLIPSNRNSIPSIEQEDFAAYQRELSRALVEVDGSPEPEEFVKVYDDIDLGDISTVDTSKIPQEGEEESMYEIPQLKRSLSMSGYEKAIDISPISKSRSSEHVPQKCLTEEPPPLPPRKERSMSECTDLRSSCGSILDEHTKDLVFQEKPRAPADTRSQRSSDDLLECNIDETEGVSCDSDVGSLDIQTDVQRKIGVQLPQPTKLKKRKSTRRKLGISLSSLKESTISFRSLEDVVLSGELHYRSKLTWTKKLVALTNGRLVCYKADKPDSRPSLIVVLQGYRATFQKRDGKRGTEITLTHEMFESYTFMSDFKEWADIWCEHINAAAEGRKAPGPVLHLIRGSSIEASESEYNLRKVSQDSLSSNLSLASSDGFDYDPGTVKVKKRDVSGTKTKRMGSFAFRATQFFEALGKKPSIRKSSSTDIYKQHTLSASRSSLSETSSPLIPELDITEEKPLEITKHIKHQGYLDIYSSFNKRKWGKRWCMVHENSFECYRTPTSEVCELEFLLRNCILIRAIKETKSELGLMLMENSKEKLTIEPMNWMEMGAWLRVLMQETSTPTVPEGLQGYMDNSNPYHEPSEITRLSDPFPASPPAPSSNQQERRVTSNDSEDDRQSTPSRNRDSGNCSAESMFGSLERRSNDNKTHPSYTDSSLPRVCANGNGDIYSQVRKPNKKGHTMENRSRSKNSPVLHEPDFSDKFDLDFSATVPSMKPGESLMDEIMSQFNSQNSSSIDVHKADNVFNFDNIAGNHGSENRKYRKTSDAAEKLCEIEKTVSPIKNEYFEAPASNATENLLCSSFLDESCNGEGEQTSAAVDLVVKQTVASEFAENCDSHRQDNDGANNMDEDMASIKLRPSAEHLGRRKSSLVYDAESVRTTLRELRTRLVQLKKDRISIRDRKLKTTSEVDREYLGAEFNRLNRECAKVQEEISYLDKLHETQGKLADRGPGGTPDRAELLDVSGHGKVALPDLLEGVDDDNQKAEPLTQDADTKTADLDTEITQNNNKEEILAHRANTKTADSETANAENQKTETNSANSEVLSKGNKELKNFIKQTLGTELLSRVIQDGDKEHTQGDNEHSQGDNEHSQGDNEVPANRTFSR